MAHHDASRGNDIAFHRQRNGRRGQGPIESLPLADFIGGGVGSVGDDDFGQDLIGTQGDFAGGIVFGRNEKLLDR